MGLERKEKLSNPPFGGHFQNGKEDVYHNSGKEDVYHNSAGGKDPVQVKTSLWQSLFHVQTEF